MEEETLAVEIETGEYQESIDKIIDTLGAIQEAVIQIGKEICKALVQLQKEAKNAGNSINSMASTLNEISRAFEQFAKWLEDNKAAEQWSQGITDAVDTVLGVIGTIAGIAGALLAGGLGAPEVIVATILMAIVSAITAAIIAIVNNWDQISLAFTTFFTETLPQLWAQFTQWVSGIAASVAEVFSVVVASIVGFFTQCWTWLESIFAGIGQWIQENVIQPIVDFFAPLVQWFGALFGSIQQTIADVFYNIGVIITGCWQIIQVVWSIVAEWFSVSVIQPVVQFFAELWNSISDWAIEAWNNIAGVFGAVAAWFDQNVIQPVVQAFSNFWTGVYNLAMGAWEGIKGVFITVAEWFRQYVVQPVTDFFAQLWNGVRNAAVQAWDGIKSVFGNVAGFFGEIFSSAWEKVVAVFSIAGEIFTDIKDGILTAFKKIVNGIILGINSVVRIPFNGINSALSTLRSINILGISPFTGLRSISVPQIPYLAQGAVLPANKPFLAMVGDQRHGTNVEAPLATIQEAVALVMNDQIGAMMAGFQALLEEQRATRLAVESIRVGDETIAAAVDRHRVRMAMMHGY